MNREVLLNKAASTCVDFTRQVLFYQQFTARKDNFNEIILIYIHNNFIDMAALQWGHLFGNHNDILHYRNVVLDPGALKSAMLENFGMSAEEWKSYWEEMRTYRDKAVAHLEPSPKLVLPNFNFAYSCVSHYYSNIIDELKEFGENYTVYPQALDEYAANRETKYSEYAKSICNALSVKA
ncbi:MAG: hypothetical protein K6L81_17750 [Agarilytica sp.]